MVKLKYVALFLLLLIPSICYATDYYVDNLCSDGAGYNHITFNCTDGSDNVRNSIADINSLNLPNSSNVYFRKGQEFNDETLTLNGTSAGNSDITIGAFGAGDLPLIDGQDIVPILIDHALVDLTLENLNCGGMDGRGTSNNITLSGVLGLTLDGLEVDAHNGSPSVYPKAGALVKISGAGNTGNIEVKNCTITNNYQDTYANTITAWGGIDASGLLFWMGGSADSPKESGTISIHDNTLSNVYSDALLLGGLQSSDGVTVYNNTISGFGEQGIDIKKSGYINIYNNDISHNGFGEKDGEPGLVALIVIGSSTTGWPSYNAHDVEIQKNYLHDCEYKSFWFLSNFFSNAYVHNNYFKDSGFAFLSESYVGVYNNIFNLQGNLNGDFSYGELSAIRVYYSTAVDYINIYNNTIYIDSSDYLYGITWEGYSGQTNNNIKNNIIVMNENSASVYPLYLKDKDSSDTSPTVSHNTYYNPNHANRVLSQMSGEDGLTDALTTDPELTTPGSVFTLDNGSNINVDSGATLNALYDDALNSATTWSPISVVTSDQNLQGVGWERGAYAYTGAEDPPQPTITDTTSTPLVCPNGQDPLSVTFQFTTDVAAYGRISTTDQTWDQMTSAKGMDNGDGTQTHSHTVSLACGQTIGYHVAASTEVGDNGAESATTEIEVVIGAEQAPAETYPVVTHSDSSGGAQTTIYSDDSGGATVTLY